MKRVISIGGYTGIRKVANFEDFEWGEMRSHIEHMEKEGYQVVVVDNP